MTVDEAIEEIKDSMHDTQSRRMAIEALKFQQKTVYCKECIYRWPNTRCNYWSNADSWFGRFVENDDFCSNGEWRRENE